MRCRARLCATYCSAGLRSYDINRVPSKGGSRTRRSPDSLHAAWPIASGIGCLPWSQACLMQARGADTALPLPVSCISFFRVTGQNEHGSQELELAISTSANVSSNQPTWLSLLIDRLLAVAVITLLCALELPHPYLSLGTVQAEVLDDAVPMCPRVATNIEARRMALFAPSVLRSCAPAYNRDEWNGGHILENLSLA